MRLVHLDQPQPLAAVTRKHRLDQRALACPTRPGEEHIVGRAAADELPCVAVDQFPLGIHGDQIVGIDAVRCRDGFKPRALPDPAPLGSKAVPEVRQGHRCGRQPLERVGDSRK